MKKNLLYGIIGGAAVGAAASYLMGARERKNFVSGIKNLSETVTDTVTGLMGSESNGGSSKSSAGSSKSASGSNTGRSASGAKSSGSKSSSSTSRRG
jgi:hypothetical protein